MSFQPHREPAGGWRWGASGGALPRGRRKKCFKLPTRTNIGNNTRTVVAVVPEVGLNIGYEIIRGMNLFLGSTFLYTNNVVRPGNHIDRGINPTQNASCAGTPPTPLVGPARPAFTFRSTDFWTQGLNVGVVFRF